MQHISLPRASCSTDMQRWDGSPVMPLREQIARTSTGSHKLSNIWLHSLT